MGVKTTFLLKKFNTILLTFRSAILGRGKLVQMTSGNFPRWRTTVRGLYDKNSASLYCFTSDVTYKCYKRLVYTHPDLLARFCKINLSNAKNSAGIFFQA